VMGFGEGVEGSFAVISIQLLEMEWLFEKE
jgi:hypothetical protein